jgi:nucleoid-associated protein YgaU
VSGPQDTTQGWNAVADRSGAGAAANRQVGDVTAAGQAAAANPSAGTVVAAGAAAVQGLAGFASTVASLIPATLSCIDIRTPSQWRIVPFDFNPNKITISRGASLDAKPSAGAGAGSPSGSAGVVVWKTNPPDISISDITFEGLSTKLRCDTLLNWMSPPGGADAMANAFVSLGKPVESQIPTLRFVWGPPLFGFFYEVKLTSCSITYERFNPMGIPVRAKVTLKMMQQVSDLSTLPTNPTSGGLPGRTMHVLKAGESLHSVAQTRFGDVGLWRRIAEVNGIVDPARVRPGRTLYLPSADELARKS